MCPRVDKAVGWGISRGYGGGVKGLLGIWLGMTCGLPVRCAEAISGLNCGGNGAGEPLGRDWRWFCDANAACAADEVRDAK